MNRAATQIAAGKGTRTLATSPEALATSGENEKAIPWWIWPIPIGLTILVLGVPVEILISKEGGFYQALRGLSLNALGDFVGGVGGALAFVWLVFGYFLQSRELRLQREELQLQRKNTANLVEATSAAEEHSRRDTALRMLDFTLPELYELSHLMFLRSFGDSTAARERNRKSLKPQFDGGDKWIYCRDIADRIREPQGTANFEQKLQENSDLPTYVSQYLEAHDRIRAIAEGEGLGWALRQSTIVANLIRPFAA